MALVYWILSYVVPAIVAGHLKNGQHDVRKRVLILHTAILISIVLLSMTGTQLVVQFAAISLLAGVIGLMSSVYLLGWHGVLYGLSSVLQEWCILLAATYLSAEYGLLIGAVATTTVFTLSHRILEWRWRLGIFFVWGVVSILLYAWLADPLINIGLHAGIGALLISRKILFNSAENA